MIGKFEPEFASYLNTLDEVDYVEPNRVYSINAVASNFPGALIQLNVPSWGVARVGHRANQDLTTFMFEDNSG